MELRAVSTGTSDELLSSSFAGVPLVVDRSWLVGFVVTTMACGAVAYAAMSSISPLAAGALGFSMALALSFSLLVHELAHAIVAQRSGIEVEHIRMFAGGALCRRKQLIDAPVDQFMVAAAGPLASTALGVAGLALSAAAPLLGLPLPVSVILWFTSLVNILIAVSNLLPIFPFDGSKLVHAMIWRSGRDRRAASVRLHRSGREFARGVTLLGVLLMAFGGELMMGVVLLLFGVYLLRLPAPPS
jgi:Zn-dependent protease